MFIHTSKTSSLSPRLCLNLLFLYFIDESLVLCQFPTKGTQDFITLLKDFFLELTVEAKLWRHSLKTPWHCLPSTGSESSLLVFDREGGGQFKSWHFTQPDRLCNYRSEIIAKGLIQLIILEIPI